MIFEAGVLLEELPGSQFAPLVSHITRDWRSIALATPRLWNKIFWDLGPTELMGEDMDGDENDKPLRVALLEKLKKATKKTAIFLLRSMSAPIDIYIRRFCDGELDHGGLEMAHMLELLHTHFHRCRHLSFHDGSPRAIEQVIEQICCGLAPLISSIDLGISHEYDDFALTRTILPCGAPHLKIAQLDWIEISSIPYFLHAFQQLRSLRLIGIATAEDVHASLASALFPMQALDHLELVSFHNWTPHLPALAQPTIRFLRLHLLTPRSDDHAIQGFRAVSLTTLSIECAGYSGDLGFSTQGSPQVSFPSLQHLILVNVKMQHSKLGSVGRIFPHIERLTFQGVNPCFEVGHVLTSMSARAIEENPDSTAEVSLLWPKLHTIAVSGPGLALTNPRLELDSQMSALQEAGVPIWRLMLPPNLVAHASGDMVARMRKLVKVEEFSLD